LNEIQLAGIIFALLFGLAFGSFLNVCLTRLPEEESVVAPRSHCRNCDHNLSWWENLPLLSWILLRGRCRSCRNWIGLRYPLVELAVGLLWAGCWFAFSPPLFTQEPTSIATPNLVAGALTQVVGSQILCWMLVALAVLDLENFWLPDLITLPGIALGFIYTLLRSWSSSTLARPINLVDTAWQSLLAILGGAGLILLIRLVYWVVRRQEGMGLGDAKLMAMLGAWLGLIGSMECFALSVFAASAAALVWLAVLKILRSTENWTKIPLPLGSFLCFAAVFEVFNPQWLFRR